MGRKKPMDPEGLWISPEGDRYSVVEHLIALARDPAAFGLTWRDVAGAPVEQLRALAEVLIRDEGWIRFRYLSGVWAFEVDNARRRAAAIEGVLVDYRAGEDERIAVSQARSPREFEGTVAEFFDRTIFRSFGNPRRNTWRITGRRKP